MADYRRGWPKCGGIFDIEAKREALTSFEARMSEPDFWNNQESAQSAVQEVKTLKGWIEPYDKLDRTDPERERAG